MTNSSETDGDPSAFGAWLSDRLDRNRWTQADLARESGLGPSIVSRYIAGQAVPSIRNARILAASLGVPLLAVLVAAGVLTADEARMPAGPAPADDLADVEIVRQVAQRLGVAFDTAT